MLRGLFYKKLLSCVIAILAVALAAYVLNAFSGIGDGVSVEQKEALPAETPQIQLASVGRFSDYDAILKSEILGKDAPPKKAKKPAPPPPKKPPKEKVITKLPLRLIGTVVSASVDPSGSAIIENRSGAPVKKTYFVGDEVMDKVFLKTIRRRAVVLENKRANRLETLQLEEGAKKFQPVKRPRPSSVRRPSPAAVRRVPAQTSRNRPALQGANRIFTLNRADTLRELEEKYDELASKVDVKIVRDAKGNVQGVQATNLSSTPLAAKFGFQEGDIVTSVNGQKVDSLDRVYDIVEKNRNATSFRVQLLRGGTPLTFTYHLR